MAVSRLEIDCGALVANWRKLDRLSSVHTQTAAVVKADGYGLGAVAVGRALAHAGAKTFFVAYAEEGAALRQALGPDVVIMVLSGHMPGDQGLIASGDLVPMLNSLDQVVMHFESLPTHPFGVQLDSGMNRLGLEEHEWHEISSIVLPTGPRLLMSHLACSDTPDDPMNARQLATFERITEGCDVPRSLAATGGILLGSKYHFDLTRPGIGLYGGLPYRDAQPVVRLSLPVIQTRIVEAGETVGYGNSWQAPERRRIATLGAGYADGVLRVLSNRRAVVWHGQIPCMLIGRISMDMIAVDVTDLSEDPDYLDLLCGEQTIDILADEADTIGYEILTSLGARYHRQYEGMSLCL